MVRPMMRNRQSKAGEFSPVLAAPAHRIAAVTEPTGTSSVPEMQTNASLFASTSESLYVAFTISNYFCNHCMLVFMRLHRSIFCQVALAFIISMKMGFSKGLNNFNIFSKRPATELAMNEGNKYFAVEVMVSGRDRRPTRDLGKDRFLSFSHLASFDYPALIYLQCRPYIFPRRQLSCSSHRQPCRSKATCVRGSGTAWRTCGHITHPGRRHHTLKQLGIESCWNKWPIGEIRSIQLSFNIIIHSLICKPHLHK